MLRRTFAFQTARIILLIGIVKKNAIMMIDFALAGGERTAGISQRYASSRPIREEPACNV